MIRLTRVAAVAAALAVSSFGTVVMTTGTAGAATAAVTCTGFKATGTTTSKGTLSGCTSSVTGGSGTTTSKENVTAHTGSDTISWKNKTTTKTTFTFTEAAAHKGQCPSTYTIYVVEKSTVVKGGTNTKVPVGQKTTANVCAKASGGGSATLATGQKFTV
jgi:hypothetical protein